MAKCFYCCHCGKCGPASYDPFRNPPGLCPFCRTQNDAAAATCASCGKPLPRPAGLAAPKKGTSDDTEA